MTHPLSVRLRARLRAVSAYDAASGALFVALVVLVFVTYRSYAVSNDEPVQQHYGTLILDYFHSGFTDRSLFHYVNLYLYGGLFDIFANLLEKLFPSADLYDVRHIFCALIGIGGIGGAWATGRLVSGPRAGAIAAFALATCGPWYGSMFNHTKDIPFAAAMVGATYFLLRVTRELPRPGRTAVFGFGLLLGAALGIRVLGLLFVGYAGLAILSHMPARKAEPVRDQLTFFAQSVVALTPAFLIAYVLMTFAWPWSALAPLNPLRGLVDFGDFNYQINTLLDGHIYQMGNVPRWYVPVYLLIKLPLLILAGTLLALPVLRKPAADAPPSWRRSETGLLMFMALFPVLCEVIDRGPAFTGLRHFLFVVPLFAVLAGIGIDWLIATLARRQSLIAAGAGAVVIALLISNAVLLVELHPYQYLYYNPLVGGLEGASRRFATDYWVDIMPEAVDDLEAYVAKLDGPQKGEHRYAVAVCGQRESFEDEARGDPSLQWVDDWSKADFFIAPTHMNCDRALDGRVIAGISRLGVLIGVVKDRRALVRHTEAHKK
ncbi:MAG TPA: glycosyltransferase family 39 protein [Pseudolabrys sp.]|nr:glycosyltransferase family 39 protein [Pseudolabrys sp.]